MAKYYTPCDKFADVESLYNHTKPVRKRSEKDREDFQNFDLRPTNCRSRQYERVVKVSRNKYLLVDGDAVWNAYWFEGINTRELFVEFLEQKAPIVWERKRDGSEVLRVRGVPNLGMYNNNPMGRNDFLDRHLPRMWRLWQSEGNTYLHCPWGKYVIPKHTFVGKKFMGMIKSNYGRSASRAQSYENQELVFTKLPDGTWISPKKTYAELKWRVDTNAKKKLKPTLDKFYHDALPLINMMDVRGPRAKDELTDDLVLHIRDNVGVEFSEWEVISALGGNAWVYNRLYENKEFKNILISIMRDSDHPQWYGLVKTLAYMCESKDSEDNRAIINNWVNRVFSLRRRVEV